MEGRLIYSSIVNVEIGSDLGPISGSEVIYF